MLICSGRTCRKHGRKMGGEWHAFQVSKQVHVMPPRLTTCLLPFCNSFLYFSESLLLFCNPSISFHVALRLQCSWALRIHGIDLMTICSCHLQLTWVMLAQHTASPPEAATATTAVAAMASTANATTANAGSTDASTDAASTTDAMASWAATTSTTANASPVESSTLEPVPSTSSAAPAASTSTKWEWSATAGGAAFGTLMRPPEVVESVMDFFDSGTLERGFPNRPISNPLRFEMPKKWLVCPVSHWTANCCENWKSTRRQGFWQVLLGMGMLETGCPQKRHKKSKTVQPTPIDSKTSKWGHWPQGDCATLIGIEYSICPAAFFLLHVNINTSIVSKITKYKQDSQICFCRCSKRRKTTLFLTYFVPPFACHRVKRQIPFHQRSKRRVAIHRNHWGQIQVANRLFMEIFHDNVPLCFSYLILAMGKRKGRWSNISAANRGKTCHPRALMLTGWGPVLRGTPVRNFGDAKGLKKRRRLPWNWTMIVIGKERWHMMAPRHPPNLVC